MVHVLCIHSWYGVKFTEYILIIAILHMDLSARKNGFQELITKFSVVLSCIISLISKELVL